MNNLKNYTDEQIAEVEAILFRKQNPISSSNILCLGQSSGSKGVMFVLYRFSNADYQFNLADPMQFQCILAQDLLEAAKKARQICGIHNVELQAENNHKRASIAKQVEMFIEMYPEIEEKLNSENYIIQDIKNYLNRKGRLSEAQISLVNKIHLQEIERKKEIAKQKREQAKYAKLEKFYFEAGERVELEIKKEIARFGFETEWGYFSIIKYITKCDKLVMYSGTSPKELFAGDKIKATIKHNIYKGAEQTILQRISIVK